MHTDPIAFHPGTQHNKRQLLKTYGTHINAAPDLAAAAMLDVGTQLFRNGGMRRKEFLTYTRDAWERAEKADPLDIPGPLTLRQRLARLFKGKPKPRFKVASVS